MVLNSQRYYKIAVYSTATSHDSALYYTAASQITPLFDMVWCQICDFQSKYLLITVKKPYGRAKSVEIWHFLCRNISSVELNKCFFSSRMDWYIVSLKKISPTPEVTNFPSHLYSVSKIYRKNQHVSRNLSTTYFSSFLHTVVPKISTRCLSHTKLCVLKVKKKNIESLFLRK